MGELEDRLARIENQLRERAILRSLPEAEPVGGPAHHVGMPVERPIHKHCGMNPPLAPAELEAFEARCGVTLPEEYRAFLLRIGDGGVGPYYGLMRLATAAEELAHYLAQDPAFLASPFPLTTKLSLLDEYRRQTGRDLDEDATEGGDDPELRARFDAFFDAYDPRRYLCGSLSICHYGCGIMFSLVVSGAERGKVWLNDFTNDTGLFPVWRRERPDEHLGFLDWYETWLDFDLSRSPSADDGEAEREDPFVLFE